MRGWCRALAEGYILGSQCFAGEVGVGVYRFAPDSSMRSRDPTGGDYGSIA